MEENNQAGGSSYKMNSESKCPFLGSAQVRVMEPQRSNAASTKSNKDWWPNQLQLNILRQHADFSNPMGETLIMQQNLKV
jgi:catalase-peroxidase